MKWSCCACPSLHHRLSQPTVWAHSVGCCMLSADESQRDGALAVSCFHSTRLRVVCLEVQNVMRRTASCDRWQSSVLVLLGGGLRQVTCAVEFFEQPARAEICNVYPCCALVTVVRDWLQSESSMLSLSMQPGCGLGPPYFCWGSTAGPTLLQRCTNSETSRVRSLGTEYTRRT